MVYEPMLARDIERKSFYEKFAYVMQDDYKVYTKVSTTTLKIVPTIALDKSLLTKGDGTIESPYEVE